MSNSMTTSASGNSLTTSLRQAPHTLKYLEVAETLRCDIVAGHYRPGSILPGQREIAERLQVSRASVKRAMQVLGDEGLIRCMASVGSIVERRAKPKVCVGYLVNNLYDPFHAAIIRELDQILRQYSAGLIVSEGTDPQRMLDLGATKIISQYDPDEPAPHEFAHTVYIGQSPAGTNRIEADDEAGMRLVYEHLKMLGHKEFGYFGYEDDARYAKLIALMAADNYQMADENITFHSARFDQGKRVIDAILASSNPPSALISFDDDRALNVMRFAQQAGIRIPEDLSVTGFDDIAMAQMIPTPLTTIRFPARATAMAAARILFDDDPKIPQHAIIDVDLVIRQTTCQLNQVEVSS